MTLNQYHDWLNLLPWLRLMKDFMFFGLFASTTTHTHAHSHTHTQDWWCYLWLLFCSVYISLLFVWCCPHWSPNVSKRRTLHFALVQALQVAQLARCLKSPPCCFHVTDLTTESHDCTCGIMFLRGQYMNKQESINRKQEILTWVRLLWLEVPHVGFDLFSLNCPALHSL